MTRVLRQPHAALADLCDGFFGELAFLERCPRLEAEELPAGARRLLVHHEHMTTVLREVYGRPVELVVQAQRQDDYEYARRVVLRLAGTERIVEVGVVRIDLRFTSPSVQAEILSRREPLGDILTRHGVLRRISPRWYFRFPGGTPIADAFGGGAEAFGRVGTIYCDEQPAIELLEVVGDGP